MHCQTTPEVSSELHPFFAEMFSLPAEDRLRIVLDQVELSRQAVKWLMEEEVRQKAGERYSHTKPSGGEISRWGSNPGSFSLGTRKVKVDVPRILNSETKTTSSPEVYKEINRLAEPGPDVVRALVAGLSTRKYRQVAQDLLDTFGLSKSRLSELFISHAEEIFTEFQNRPLGADRYVALFVDGKVVQGHSMIAVVGVTADGVKRSLGFVEAVTENKAVVTELFRGLIRRGLHFDDGLLLVVDGSKGLRSAITAVFGEYAVVQRCQVHKIKNVLQYLTEDEKTTWKPKLATIFSEPIYSVAKAKATEAIAQLKTINRSASGSLEEGLEECLTLQRLGVYSHIGRSFANTNIIESFNSIIERTTKRITIWENSDQRQRWFVTGLLEAEAASNRVPNHKKIFMLQEVLATEIKRQKPTK